jgi:hypothetical protein
VREDLATALRGLSADELLGARRYVERLLEELASRPGARRSPPSGVAERRRFDRYSVDLRATYLCHSTSADERPGGPRREAVVRDISRGGLRFFAHEALEPGELLTIHLPGPLGVRKLVAEVLRVERRGSQYQCAAAFVDLDRIVAARQGGEARAEAVRVLVAWEPCPERDALTDLLVKQGYTAHVANGVPEVLRVLALHRRVLVLASAPLLLADGGALLRELEGRAADVVSVAIATISELDGPGGPRLRACHDFLCEPDRPQEVRVVVGRACRRLLARRGRQPGRDAT